MGSNHQRLYSGSDTACYIHTIGTADFYFVQTPKAVQMVCDGINPACPGAHQPGCFYWLQIESAHAFDLITTVILIPLVLGSWLLAWWHWHKLVRPVWVPRVILLLTFIYMCVQLLGLPWVAESLPHTVFDTLSKAIRLVFVLLLLYIIYRGIRQRTEDKGLVLLATLLVATGLFAPELSALHIQGIWFPFGVGVSRSQYAYMAFDVILFIILIRHYKRQKQDPGVFKK